MKTLSIKEAMVKAGLVATGRDIAQIGSDLSHSKGGFPHVEAIRRKDHPSQQLATRQSVLENVLYHKDIESYSDQFRTVKSMPPHVSG
jgi:hypothetical protein